MKSLLLSNFLFFAPINNIFCCYNISSTRGRWIKGVVISLPPSLSPSLSPSYSLSPTHTISLSPLTFERDTLADLWVKRWKWSCRHSEARMKKSPNEKNGLWFEIGDQQHPGLSWCLDFKKWPKSWPKGPIVGSFSAQKDTFLSALQCKSTFIDFRIHC